jgi:hypothetical protein
MKRRLFLASLVLALVLLALGGWAFDALRGAKWPANHPQFQRRPTWPRNKQRKARRHATS